MSGFNVKTLALVTRHVLANTRQWHNRDSLLRAIPTVTYQTGVVCGRSSDTSSGISVWQGRGGEDKWSRDQSVVEVPGGT